MSDTNARTERPEGQATWPAAGVGARVEAPPTKEAGPKRVLGSVGFLLDSVRRRRAGRLGLWFVVVALALTGIGLLSYPFITDLWADRIQGDLETQWASTDPGRIDVYRSDGFQTGEPVTRLRIPSLGVNVLVVEGISGNALRAGAGHYPTSSLPGEATGNVGIAGHRTGFGEPFRHLERLSQGDDIWLDTPIGKFRYKVIGGFDGHPNPWITTADDWTVVSNTPEPSLTLTTCDPPGTSLHRLIVRAVLDSVQPA